MMMKKYATRRFFLVAMLAVAGALLLLAGAPTAEAVDCVPDKLKCCTPSVVEDKPPTAECCQNLKEQESCLCKYIKDPRFSKYWHMPRAPVVLAICGVPFPKC